MNLIEWLVAIYVAGLVVGFVARVVWWVWFSEPEATFTTDEGWNEVVLLFWPLAVFIFAIGTCLDWLIKATNRLRDRRLAKKEASSHDLIGQD